MTKVVAVVQCHLVQQRCSGYLCDRSFVTRTDGFQGLDFADDVRKLSFTCGGCCGRALHRKLMHLKKMAKKMTALNRTVF
jgi:predicted metal-binding protein